MSIPSPDGLRALPAQPNFSIEQQRVEKYVRTRNISIRKQHHMSLRNIFCSWSAFAVISALCGSPELAAQDVRDSAGIRIVVNTKPAWTATQQLRLSATPTLIIGNRDEDPYQLTRVRGAFYLSDGRIALGEAASNEIRVYDAQGKHLKTFGRKGDGPGEFRSITKVVRLAGDTIAVIHEHAAISRFTGAGKYVTRTADDGTVDFSKPGATTTGILLALNGGARLAVRVPLRPQGGSIGTQFDAKGFHEIINGAGVSTKKPGDLPWMQAMAGKDGAEKPWLGAEEVYAGNGSQFYLGYGTHYSLTRYSTKGVPDLIIRRAWTATPVTEKDWENWADEWLKRWSKKTGAELAAERKDLLDDDYFETLPAFSAILLDNTGKLWVRAPKAIDGAVAGSLNDYSIGPSAWSVFSPTGVWLGDITMPSKFTPTDIGADYVLGIARDDDVTPTVARYKLGTKP